MPTITFSSAGVTAEVRAGTSLLDAAQEAGVAVPTSCGGKASCHLCKVKILDGFDAISPMQYTEESALGNVFFITHERLACQTQVIGDVTLDIADAPPPAPKKKPRRFARPNRRTSA